MSLFFTSQCCLFQERSWKPQSVVFQFSRRINCTTSLEIKMAGPKGTSCPPSLKNLFSSWSFTLQFLSFTRQPRIMQKERRHLKNKNILILKSIKLNHEAVQFNYFKLVFYVLIITFMKKIFQLYITICYSIFN